MSKLLEGLEPRRKRAGLSQADLSIKSGIKLWTIQKHEAGKYQGINGKTLTALALALECKPYELFLPLDWDKPKTAA
jgi:DNA-binding Xre family transcriptional regulator